MVDFPPFCTYGMLSSYLCKAENVINFLGQYNSIIKYFYYRPTTNAIMGLTFANYVLQPFFSADCGVPILAAQLLAAATICKYN